jgi:signal transduction histidine kinase/CheY-like chemotaxis protein
VSLPELTAGLAIAVLLATAVHSSRVSRRRRGELEDEVKEHTTRLEAALERLRRENGERERSRRALAEKEIQARDALLRVLGHQLRNPLASIESAVDALTLQPENREVAARMHDILRRQVHQLARLADDLLDVSRVECGKLELHLERLDLLALVDHACQCVQPRAQAAGLDLAFEPGSGILWVDADPVRLRQVIDNLLANAIEFTGRGDEIRVRLQPEGDQALLRVSDSGRGVDPRQRADIFDPFVQGREGTEAAAGLGIGLALVRSLVSAHGGSMEVASGGPGTGSEFSVRLPLRSPPTEKRGRSPLAPATRRRRVLLVDDEPDLAEGLAEILRLDGHEVEVALDGPAALELARRFRPELVVCDLGLPGMDGYEVAARLRSSPETAACRLLALSGYGDHEALRRAREAGFDLHLTKPVGSRELREVLASESEPPRGASRPDPDPLDGL